MEIKEIIDVFCLYCGKGLTEDNLFCTECGNKVIRPVSLPTVDNKVIRHDTLPTVDNKTILMQENSRKKLNRSKSTPTFQPVNLQQTSAEILENINKMYESHHKCFPLKYTEISLIVKAHSLKTTKKRNDEVILSLTFKTGEHRVFCHEVGLKTNSDTFLLKEVAFEVSDKDGNEVNTFYILSSSSKLIVFFEEPLPANEGPYKIICRTSVNDFVSDNKLSLRAIRTSGTVDKVNIILQAPKESKIALSPPPRGKDVISGEEMTNLELSFFEKPIGFEIMGWKTRNLPPNAIFIANIVHG